MAHEGFIERVLGGQRGGGKTERTTEERRQYLKTAKSQDPQRVERQRQRDVDRVMLRWGHRMRWLDAHGEPHRTRKAALRSTPGYAPVLEKDV